MIVLTLSQVHVINYNIDMGYGVNATFDNISVIPWCSVLLVEETEENHRSTACHRQTLVLWVRLWCLKPLSTIFQ